MYRNGIGIEILPEYFQNAHEEILPAIELHPSQLTLLEKRKKYESTKSE